MALSIASGPAAGTEPQNTNHTFSSSLERLGQSLRQSGTGARPAAYGEQSTDPRVTPTELSKSVRDTSDSVSEARTAGNQLTKVEGLLGKARSLAFEAVNEPGQREREHDQAEFTKVAEQIDGIATGIVFGGGPLLAGSKSFGEEGALGKVDLSSFQGSIGAIQVIDRAISEVTDQRGLLGIFQSSKLSAIGNMLRSGISSSAGVVSSSAVIRDRVSAVQLAQTTASQLQRQHDSSLLGSNNAAGQILASIVGRL